MTPYLFHHLFLHFIMASYLLVPRKGFFFLLNPYTLINCKINKIKNILRGVGGGRGGGGMSDLVWSFSSIISNEIFFSVLDLFSAP